MLLAASLPLEARWRSQSSASMTLTPPVRSKRVEVDLDKLNFVILNDLFADGDAYTAEPAALKLQEKERKASAAGKLPPAKRRKGEALREKDPW